MFNQMCNLMYAVNVKHNIIWCTEPQLIGTCKVRNRDLVPKIGTLFGSNEMVFRIKHLVRIISIELKNKVQLAIYNQCARTVQHTVSEGVVENVDQYRKHKIMCSWQAK